MTEQLYDIDESEMGDYGPEDADSMLDALVEADGDFAERRRSRSRGRAPGRKTGGPEVQRNAQGIKAINDRITALDGKVNQAVGVIARDRAAIRKMEKLAKIDGALDLASSFDPAKGINVFQVLKGSLKSGFLGEPKGALGNPAVIGAVGLFLNNPGILGSILGPKP